MPVVKIEMWEGRSVDEKKQLVQGITSEFVKIGVPAEALHIIINRYWPITLI